MLAQDIVIAIVDDAVMESTETIELVLDSIGGAEPGITLHTIEIADDEGTDNSGGARARSRPRWSPA